MTLLESEVQVSVEAANIAISCASLSARCLCWPVLVRPHGRAPATPAGEPSPVGAAAREAALPAKLLCFMDAWYLSAPFMDARFMMDCAAAAASAALLVCSRLRRTVWASAW